MLKKQYLISGIILVLAVALIVVYFVFLREEAPETETDPFFVLSDEAQGAARYAEGRRAHRPSSE